MKSQIPVKIFFLLACLLLVLAAFTSFDNSKVHPSLKKYFKANETPQLVWIFFTDKGDRYMQSYFDAQKVLSKKTLKRRSKNKANVIDDRDFAIHSAYLQLVKEAGLEIRHTSRWLNAVSGWATSSTVEKLSSLYCVKRIDPVGRFRMSKEHSESEGVTAKSVLIKSANAFADSAFYGTSFTQLNLSEIPAVHDSGFFGQDVIISMFDTGFDNLTHEAFDSLTILATWDFVNNDTSVANDPGQLGNGSHGTKTLSMIGSYQPGKLVGPAYRAHFLLAKTENTTSETSLEEDNWIAALEWAEAHGADIISSSVGYIEMDAGSPRSYDWTWMSGDSTLITKAANIGVSHGLVIVNSAGNEGSNSQHNTLGAPSDGDSIIAVGAVTSSKTRAGFSSVGPTTKGRIKPDVMAMGYNVKVASSSSQNGYEISQGTSFACPLVAGMCAQILTAHPDWTPTQVRLALIRTADRANNPNNQYGYGIVNVLSAIQYEFPIDTGAIIPTQFVLHQNQPNPFNPGTVIRYDVLEEGKVKIEVYNSLGQKIRTVLNQNRPALVNQTVTWDGKDERGKSVASGVYFYRMTIKGFSKTKKMLLLK
ncbi:S8 family serine peptidase [bacterium]|nr:S8 family serine peptidase [bacterium]